MDKQLVQDQLPFAITEVSFPVDGAEQYSGKIRENFVFQGCRFMVATDRITTFEIPIGAVPFKGEILNRLSAFWFEHTKDIVPNHLIEVIDPNVSVVKDCHPLPLEMVVRGYITGVTTTAMWYHYESGSRNFCGHVLPNGLRKNQRLPEPIITPSTKMHGKHTRDKSVSPKELLEITGIDSALYEQLASVAIQLFRRGSAIAANRGLILVDTKYEFGLDADGQVTLIDEIHTTDSSRYWKQDQYERAFRDGVEPAFYDKEYLRLWLYDRGLTEFGQDSEREKLLPKDIFIELSLRFAEVYESLTGETVNTPVGDPTVRIQNNIKAYLERARLT
jgi:phosphoribosylaminoimidazole-succinocarboxamide synthase